MRLAINEIPHGRIEEIELSCRKRLSVFGAGTGGFDFLYPVPAAIAIFDNHMRYLGFSQRWLTEYRLEATDIHGRSHYDVFPEIPLRWRALHAQCLSGVAFRCPADPFPRDDGGVDWIKWELQPWFCDENEVGGIVMLTEVIARNDTDGRNSPREPDAATKIVRDSERTGLPQAAAERRTRQVFDNLPLGYCVTDLNGHLIDVNTGLATLLGREPSDLFHVPFATLISDAGAEIERHHLRLLAECRSASYRVEAKLRAQDGRLIDCEIYGAPIYAEDGRVEFVVRFISDIADRRQFPKISQQAGKLEAVGRLAGGIAHDFNNLLTVIAGNIAVAKAKLSGDDEVSVLLTEAEEAGRRGGDLVKNLLAFTARRESAAQPTDLVVVSRRILNLLRRMIGEDIDLQLSAESHPITAMIDPIMFEACILNLCVNSRDAMPSGGTITMTLERVDVGTGMARTLMVEKPGHYAVVTVTDDGEGMTQDILDRAMEPFFSTKEPGKGSGLGLSMAYSFARQCHGQLKLHSEPGLGTTVKLFLPIADQRVEPGTDDDGAAPAVRGHGERILLVEDQEDVRRTLSRMLTILGYTVTAAADAAEALQIYFNHGPFAAVVTDVTMPKMSGYEMAQILRSEDKALPILFVSGNADEPGGRAEDVGGPIGIVGKPVDLTELSNVLETLLGGPPES